MEDAALERASAGAAPHPAEVARNYMEDCFATVFMDVQRDAAVVKGLPSHTTISSRYSSRTITIVSIGS